MKELLSATWKRNNLWILTKPDTSTPTVYSLQEISNWGVLQGRVDIYEK